VSSVHFCPGRHTSSLTYICGTSKRTRAHISISTRSTCILQDRRRQFLVRNKSGSVLGIPLNPIFQSGSILGSPHFASLACFTPLSLVDLAPVVPKRPFQAQSGSKTRLRIMGQTTSVEEKMRASGLLLLLSSTTLYITITSEQLDIAASPTRWVNIEL
jgi:hypothetical protein